MIEINNLTGNKIDEEEVKKIVGAVLSKEGRKGDVSIAFIGPGRMRKLNKKYRKVNRATDVLSFSEREVEFGAFAIGDIKKSGTLGEIVVCPREILKVSRRGGAEFQKEISRVLIHGALHLLGYDHEQSEKESDIMKKKEEEYLEKSKIKITNVKPFGTEALRAEVSNPKSK